MAAACAAAVALSKERKLSTTLSLLDLFSSKMTEKSNKHVSILEETFDGCWFDVEQAAGGNQS